MPKLLISEPDFRLVEDIIGESVVHILEVRDGVDAMGAERWREFKVDSANLRRIFGYLVRMAIEREAVSAANK